MWFITAIENLARIDIETSEEWGLPQIIRWREFLAAYISVIIIRLTAKIIHQKLQKSTHCQSVPLLLTAHTLWAWALNFHCNSTNLLLRAWVWFSTTGVLWPLGRRSSSRSHLETFRLFMCIWGQVILSQTHPLPLWLYHGMLEATS